MFTDQEAKTSSRMITTTDILLALILFFTTLQWQRESPLVNYIKKRIVFVINSIVYYFVRSIKFIFRW